jgi:hypothetical protein
MTKQRTLAMLLGTAAVLAGSGVGAARAQTTMNPDYAYGPYIGAAGGGSFLNDISPNGGGADTKSQFDKAMSVSARSAGASATGSARNSKAAIAATICEGVRGSAPATAGGALGTDTVMVNGLYDIDPRHVRRAVLRLRPHVGVGVGWARPRFDHASELQWQTVSGKDDVLAYQGIAGVDYTR